MEDLKKIKLSVSDLPDDFYRGKRVFVRVDFNVPISNGEVVEDYRLRRSIPTIEYLISRNAKIILCSHLGRPRGKTTKRLSLKPVGKRLSAILNNNVTVKFVDGCVEEKVRNKVKGLNEGEILLLENIRFYKEEEKNDKEFSKKLASLAEIYVNDAFSTSHREHSSTHGVGKFFNFKIAGFLIRKEVDVLSKVRDNPKRPFILVLGGSKISDKIHALKHLISKADKVMIGGGLSYTFLASKGLTVGNSLIDKEFISWARGILNKHQKKIFLPVDHVVVSDLKRKSDVRVVPYIIPDGYTGLDIGPKTTSLYTHEIINSKGTIFWNGPMGLFEDEEFSHGTIDIARAISIAYWRGTKSVVGGGDTAAALRKAEVLESEIDFLSTGGGATLKFLGGFDLPGVSILDDLNMYKVINA